MDSRTLKIRNSAVDKVVLDIENREGHRMSKENYVLGRLNKVKNATDRFFDKGVIKASKKMHSVYIRICAS